MSFGRGDCQVASSTILHLESATLLIDGAANIAYSTRLTYSRRSAVLVAPDQRSGSPQDHLEVNCREQLGVFGSTATNRGLHFRLVVAEHDNKPDLIT